jgi:DNA (cytosine-5)-methyltransferase 1
MTAPIFQHVTRAAILQQIYLLLLRNAPIIALPKGRRLLKSKWICSIAARLDPAAERSRATMWDVCRFAEYHSYNAIIVENVVDARKWVMFDAWLTAMYALGYNHKCVYLNSMHCHPTPQSRDRMYIVFWKKGNKAPMLDYTPLAYCYKCESDTCSTDMEKTRC